MTIDVEQIAERVRHFLDEAGLVVKHLDLSGGMAMCGTTRKPHGTDGRYKVHLDFPPTLWLMNYHEGGVGRSFPLFKQGELDAIPEDEREALRERIRQRKLAAMKEREERQKKAAREAQELFKGFTLAGADNPYLHRKGVRPAGNLCETRDGRLVVPMMNEEGQLVSLQYISEDGSKRYLPGGEKKGCFFSVPAANSSEAGPLLIGEGVATVLSACAATGYAGLVAFDAYNLKAVAEAARARQPEREITLLADNDCTFSDGRKREGESNTGVFKAREAAQAISTRLAVCPVIDGRSTDFNDLHVARGLDAVREAVDAADVVEDCGIAPDPRGFITRRKGRSKGLFWIKETEKDGGTDWQEIRVGDVLDVIGESRDADGGSWGRWLRWHDADGREHLWALPASLLAGDGTEIARTLFEMGWKGDPTQKRHLLRYLAAVSTEKRVRCVERTGWHDAQQGKPVYVLPDAAIGDSGAEKIVLQTGNYRTDSFRCRGILEGQQEMFQLSLGNSRLLLAVCASLAGPLMRLSGVDSGGFHFYGGSSTGKSTALHVGGAVWDYYQTLPTWRSTDNALEGQLALRSDNVQVLDEIHQCSDKVLSDAVYLLGNGRGKARARADASLKAPATWVAMILSSGESSVATRIEASGKKAQAGQAVRLVDIPADAGAGHGLFEELHGYPGGNAFSIALKDISRAHCGHAGREFLRYVTANMDAIKQDVSGVLSEATALLLKEACPEGCDGQVQRVAQRFALCAYAGHLAVLAGLFGDAIDAERSIRAGIRKCFAAWVEGRGGTAAGEDMAILQDVTRFFEQHGSSRFQLILPDGQAWTTNSTEKVMNQCGYRAPDARFFFVMRESFRRDVCAGHDAKRAASLLHRRRHLRKNGDKYTMRLTIDKAMQTGYRIDMSIISGLADAGETDGE